MTTLRSALAVILDESACPNCLGEGIGTGSLRPLGEVCWACKGAGLAGDLDPHTLARLTRWATYSQQGREMVAAVLPEARVAGPWVLPEGYGGYRHDLHGEQVGRVYWDGAFWRGEAGTDSHDMLTAEAARAWCDEQLRAAGRVLVGGAAGRVPA